MARFPSVGEEFGGYRITRQIGRGGMGVVFAAEQRGLGRTVALKVLAPELAEQPDYRTRFSREATVLARLDSPHVIQVFDHGEQDGCLYIATQYIGGGDLSDTIREHGPVPPARAASIAAQVAWALRDSHAAGVVHRDLKPSNVLLRDVGGDAYAYLCDFGIAQDRNPGLTVAGAVAGTFAYLAPERLRGEPATASADLYALGCVLWTMLVGAAPYAGSDVEIGMAHVSAPVPQVRDGSPLARAVNDVLQRSLAKDPAHRYPDADAMRAALGELARVAGAAPHPTLEPVATPRTPLGPPPSGPPPSSPPSSGPPSSGPPPPSTPPRPPSDPAGWVTQVPGPYPPSPSAPRPAPASRKRRTAVVVAATVAAVLAVVGGVAAAVVVSDDGDGDPVADPTTSTSVTGSTSPSSPTSPVSPTPSETPTTPVTPTTPTPDDPPEPPPRRRTPKPTYPDVPAATGIVIDNGPATLRAPAGWGLITQTDVGGVGARDYSDVEGYYSSVFIRRSEPVIPLTSLPLLKITALQIVRNVDNQPGLEVESSRELPNGWLDGQEVVRTQATYYNRPDDLYFTEETWFVQRGTFLYRVTFQHSKIDTAAERRAQIDPMVVSFRWK